VNNVRLDLNLVVILEAIMLERNVTRAAASLAMSQPAVSNALRRARSLTGDELFLKVADGVQPTARMQAMWPEIQQGLTAIRANLAPEHFDPASDSTTFRLAVTDSIAVEAVSAVVLRLRSLSPFAKIAFAIHTNANSLDAIDRGTLDCAVGMFPALPRDMHVQALRTDRYICVMREGHDLAKQMTLDKFAAASHVLVMPSGTDLGIVDVWLNLQGRTRAIAVIVNHFVDALGIVADTDLLTCVPTGFIQGYGRTLMKKNKLTAVDLPFETEKLLYRLVWHRRLQNHPAHRWFRSLVAEVCSHTIPAAIEPNPMQRSKRK
jgi:DNA-binding transcriptional LysR family regulator